MLIKVYITAKLEHAHKLAQLNPDGFHINARWIEMSERGRQRNKPVSHWQQENFDDIIAAHFFLFYAEPGDELKGSIGETFFAMAHNKKVWIAGNASSVNDENWGVGIKPDGAENEIRIPNKAIMPWAMFPQRIRVVSSLKTAFSEMRAYALQERILDAGGLEKPQRVEFA